MQFERNPTPFLSAVAMGVALSVLPMAAASAQEKRPNIVMLMTDDTGWNDFGAYGGGANLGHPTPNIDRIAQEGAVFTSWYGPFMTGRIPIRSALSVVVVPGDENGLTKSTPTIAESSRRTATAPISPANGILAISPSSTRSNMASTR
jgi:Sulfatase